jgi:hypothetical protein
MVFSTAPSTRFLSTMFPLSSVIEIKLTACWCDQ